MLLIALALGLVESTNSNLGINSLPSSTAASNSIAAGSDGNAVIEGVPSAVSIFSHPTMNAATGTNGGISASTASGVGGGLMVTNGGSISWDSNATIRSAPGDWSIEQCLIWQRPHHMYFQLGNAFLLLAFLAPHRPFGILWLRSMLVVAAVLLAMYGYLIDCAQDVVLWSSLFLGINSIYLIIALCGLRPVRFEREIDAVSSQ